MAKEKICRLKNRVIETIQNEAQRKNFEKNKVESQQSLEQQLV